MAPSVGSQIRTPKTVDEVTATWLTDALRVSYPAVEVKSCALENVLWGMAGKARFRLTYNEAGARAGLPSTLMVKAGFGKWPAEFEWNYIVEVWAYKHVLPDIDANAPACFYAGVDSDGRAVIIMEDLVPRKVDFCNILLPLDYAQASRFIDCYARIHAKWWDSPELGEAGKFGFLAQTMDRGNMGAGFWIDHCLQPQNWEKATALPRAAAMPRSLCSLDQMRSGLASLAKILKAGPLCIDHGDEHLNNLFLEADGRPGFVDWQSKKEAWHLPFSFFLCGALDIENRREWEQSLLAYYLERLSAYGVASPPCYEEAWLRYRQSLIWGYFIWYNNPVEYQPEVYEAANTNRFGMAILDHDSFGLLRRDPGT
jgi:hypothetical protein